ERRRLEHFDPVPEPEQPPAQLARVRHRCSEDDVMLAPLETLVRGDLPLVQMRGRLLVERCDEPDLLPVNGVCEALLFYVGLQCESRRGLCGRLEYLRPAHPVQGELTCLLMVT